MEDGHAVFLEQGQTAYDAYMAARENKPLRPGVAFPLVRKLLALNDADNPERVSVALLSGNSVPAGIRVLRSAESQGLAISRAVFTTGAERFHYADALDVSLYLSADPSEVRAARARGLPAALVMPADASADERQELRLAFDGDSVLFSDEAERVMQASGLAAFHAHEQANAQTPLGPGPLRQFCESLAKLRALGLPVRIALVTARGVAAHARAIGTLRHWGLSVDELFLLGGTSKGPVLKAFGADLFFDDSARNIESARAHGVAAGHVPLAEPA
jgi:5'-nucleotidase